MNPCNCVGTAPRPDLTAPHIPLNQSSAAPVFRVWIRAGHALISHSLLTSLTLTELIISRSFNQLNKFNPPIDKTVSILIPHHPPTDQVSLRLSKSSSQSNTTTSPTPRMAGIPLSHAPDGVGYKLLELPAELVELIESDDAPAT